MRYINVRSVIINGGQVIYGREIITCLFAHMKGPNKHFEAWLLIRTNQLCEPTAAVRRKGNKRAARGDSERCTCLCAAHK